MGKPTAGDGSGLENRRAEMPCEFDPRPIRFTERRQRLATQRDR